MLGYSTDWSLLKIYSNVKLGATTFASSYKNICQIITVYSRVKEPEHCF